MFRAPPAWRSRKLPWLFSALLVSMTPAGARGDEDPASTRDRRRKVEPTHRNVRYGAHERNVLDFWKAASPTPTPLVIYIHGGGFRGGSKESLNARTLRGLLEARISVAAINYRLLPRAPLPAAHHDSRRALQFLRSRAGEWNIDRSRVGGFGGSAGAQLCMYLAFHDEMADPSSTDAVARESTRLSCVATGGGQTTMDFSWWKKWIPGYDAPHRNPSEIFGTGTERGYRETVEEISALSLISRDDPPIFMSYSMAPDDPVPDDPRKARGWKVHHVMFGVKLEEKMRGLGVEADLKYPGARTTYRSNVHFFVSKLTAKSKTGKKPPKPEKQTRQIDPGQPRRAAVRGLRVVEKAARNYPDHRQCFSCHHQTLPLLAMVTARDHGLRVDRELLEDQAEFTLESFHRLRARMREGKGVGGASLTVGYGLWTLYLVDHEPDETTTAMVTFLLENQEPPGHWQRTTSRPPLEDSNVTCTVLAAHYIQKYASGDQQGDVKAAVERVKSWLLGISPRSQEDTNSLLGGLSLLRAGDDKIRATREAILQAQQEDGGWAQVPGMKSDAYATGQTLFGLERSGMKTTHRVYRRGVQFLLDTQLEDGSWFVESRSKPIQIFFDNGDPHGKHQFISISATSWAATALALALPGPVVRSF